MEFSIVISLGSKFSDVSRTETLKSMINGIPEMIETVEWVDY